MADSSKQERFYRVTAAYLGSANFGDDHRWVPENARSGRLLAAIGNFLLKRHPCSPADGSPGAYAAHLLARQLLHQGFAQVRIIAPPEAEEDAEAQSKVIY